MIEPNKILEELTILLFGIRMNIFKKEEIVAFSDEQINREEKPDYLFIDLSVSAQNKNDIIEKLSSYIASNRNKIDTRKLLDVMQHLYASQQLNLESTVRLLYMLNSEFELGKTISNEIQRLDDQYHLVSNKYIEQTLNELNKELGHFLESYKTVNLRLTIFEIKR